MIAGEGTAIYDCLVVIVDAVEESTTVGSSRIISKSAIT